MNQEVLPLLPLRDVVVFPAMVIPLFVGREKSINALEEAMAGDKRIMLIAQKDASDDAPGIEGLHSVGTVATILQLLRLPDGTVKVLVEGEERASLERLIDESDLFRGQVVPAGTRIPDERENEVLTRSLTGHFEQYVQLSKKVPSEVLSTISGVEDVSRLSDTIAAHISLKLEEKQAVLEMFDPKERVEHLMELMESEIDLLKVEKRIRGRVKKQMEKSQREYYLNEQMKAIQKELGDLEDGSNEFDELTEKIEKVGLTTEAKEKAEAELRKLRMMSPMSAEASVVRGYLDWLLNLPWKKRSRLNHDLVRARDILDADHYGLEEVKERILEYLAVQNRVKKVKGAVLCLVGPPGVGKTSLGKSIARATNRQFTRMSLGGVRDEAEIRGHRRTYIGSMPGKLVQRMTKVGVRNPLFLLDEIDKMGMDNRGDPASALLEVLDPEQNNTFADHYLEVDYDLSDVMFVCTSNSMNIPGPLLDRMEVIRIPGYTEAEKVNIAQRYLLPKQIKQNGLKADEIELPESQLRSIIRHYTREAGVRGLERELAKLCRRVVKTNMLSQTTATCVITEELLEEFLGVTKYSYGLAGASNEVGQVTGLAWTSVGGELLTLEAAATPGKGRIIKTGSLGDVMQESIQAALTVVRSRAPGMKADVEFFEKNDIHVHVPEGATPKDGPSAGIGMATALASVLTGIPVKAEVAMTGEITLRGKVLAIGGLKEKLLAAHRGGIKTVIIPRENEKDLRDIPENIKQDLTVVAVDWIDEVLDLALESSPDGVSAPIVPTDDASVSKDEGSRPKTH
ncbi:MULTISPECIES: endopeptidase La [unclassified Oceanobacter]|jgi:ATP-dependent Lon protease|uniref:endopeptidase La n=2 Tax=Gammaproteobacteria TaxID=1236 RepID=UPI0026E47B57|nr:MULTISPECIES: endopeptidase La [unclassified Oceanobacter]MDO6681165.1 endopeptidase La [Oceanobacter sp. 5_MG-2023]MDP2504263.1 endopeptidase La [Oceanobacter sp. 3_MG-2023]MDP2546702.1 endopeptidase La [Oceanobacter sp. 4_MG-2023]MDP2608558.1 endopeptidase La [Oceanobacter sp. 1_MG-2023]MDP2611680.1 endopeptidase La [Oceanobacter sp. 2_MG-2023]